MKTPYLLSALVLAISTQASAEIYRCANASGGTTYQSQPCLAEGEAMGEARISITPAQQAPSAEQRTEADVAASRERQQEIRSSEDRIRQLRADNADPERCAAARAGLARAEASAGSSMDVSVFELRQQVSLYCGN